MKNIRNLGTALVLAGFVAASMIASTARLHAAGPGTGGGRSNSVICGGLKVVYDGAVAAGYLDQAAQVKDYAASISCDVSAW